MSKDPFGNLRDWGNVLETLEKLDEDSRMAECQRGLIRILRYKGNWRLREEALRRIGKIDAPCEEMIRQVTGIIADDNTYYEARIMASETLAKLAAKNGNGSNGGPKFESGEAAEKLRRLLSVPQPPIFHQALENCLRAIA